MHKDVWILHPSTGNSHSKRQGGNALQGAKVKAALQLTVRAWVSVGACGERVYAVGDSNVRIESARHTRCGGHNLLEKKKRVLDHVEHRLHARSNLDVQFLQCEICGSHEKLSRRRNQ